MNSKIYIIGAGAIGKALAVSLKQAGKSAVIIRGSVDNLPAYDQKIRLILSDGAEVEESVEFDSFSNVSELNGLVVLANKSFGNENLSVKLKDKISDSPLVILQNGLGVEQPFIDRNFPEIYRCVLFATSQQISENSLTYKPVADSPIGIIKTKGERLDEIVDAINSPNFKFKADKEIQTVIWKKAIANCVFNSICPLLEIDNGVFYRNEDVLDLAKRVIKECVLIAVEAGVKLERKEVEDLVVSISEKSDGQFISTLQDIRNGRQTEIDTLNFEVARIAESFGKQDFVRETKLLGEMVKLKSELSRS